MSRRLKQVEHGDVRGSAQRLVEREALQRLLDLTVAVDTSAKYEALLAHLRGIGVGPGFDARVVVFAERVATLTWLAARLRTDLALPDNAVAVMHGGLTDEEQQRVVDQFKQASAPVRVLVTGDVASEGVNLHAQCHELVHYDIPWSLIRIEQRNGRIDRYGQKHPPRITTLLLRPSDSRFAGDIRILASLVDKEHEAHTALGDVASLMGTYDVKGEEEILSAVLAGTKALDDVVRTPEQVAAGDDLDALFLELSTAPPPVQVTSEVPAHHTGLFADQVSYLEEALYAAYEEADPAAPVSQDGIAWQRNASFGTAQLAPPRDLRQRLDVLPQSYLTYRRVSDQLVLATTPLRGKERLAEALADASGSSWPDAHYLSPLHPVLDWAGDRALARLGRNEVFAVRGSVPEPTVLLLGTLTNRRGQVISASWLTVAFPDGDASFPLTLTHGAVAAALSALGVDGTRANPGGVPDADRYTMFVAPAVRSATGAMRGTFAAAAADVTARVEAWTARLGQWHEQAELLPQTNVLRQRRTPIDELQVAAGAMLPDRQLIRPLLVVVPEH